MSRPSVLITGGAQRIGATISRRFSEAGWHVIIHCNKSKIQGSELAKSLPFAEAVSCDLSDGKQARKMVHELAKRIDNWRCLVNNAAIFSPDSVTELDEHTNRQSMQVNAITPAILAQEYFAHARSENGRRVIQITDQKLANLNPDFFSYTMSKSAADIAARMIGMNTGIDDKVFCLAPGAILPSHDQSEQEADVSHRMNLLKRRTQANEVADSALFIATGPLANGQTIYIDSGQHLLPQSRDVINLARANS